MHTQPVKVSQGSTYSELLSVIEEMSREIRPTYAGSKSAMERLKRGTFYLSTNAHLFAEPIMVCSSAVKTDAVPAFIVEMKSLQELKMFVE